MTSPLTSQTLPDFDRVTVRVTSDPREIEAAQRLRYQVFYEEYGAIPDDLMRAQRRDMDAYDAVTDHLIVVDESRGQKEDSIVGTYRLLRREPAERFGHFYTSTEYDISPLLSCGSELLELGRSCVLAPYRTRPVLQKLWEGIAHYVADHQIGLMFGCASLHGTHIDDHAEALSYLHHYHLAAADLCPRALPSFYVDMNQRRKEDLDAKRVFASLPPLIKGYIRLGASIGDGAIIDHQFNTTDVCIVMPTHHVTEKYMRHYERKTQKIIPGGSGTIEPVSPSKQPLTA
ncbi:MAG: GNAT family N-acetyltransferase [Alphaproteobacteria bacterium]|nr:GNAT family N-acetyltransferase [Alphaproteobacteria bacterium]